MNTIKNSTDERARPAHARCAAAVLPPPSPSRLLRIQDWEKLAREAKFQPALMAALCPISLRQLQRFFARRFRQTPEAWLRELRCRLARQRISEGWSNKAAAQELGFVDGSHLCREFRKFYGASPQTFAPLYGAGAPGKSL